MGAVVGNSIRGTWPFVIALGLVIAMHVLMRPESSAPQYAGPIESPEGKGVVSLLPAVLNPLSEGICLETENGSEVRCIQDLDMGREKWAEKFLKQAEEAGWKPAGNSDLPGLVFNLVQGELKMQVRFTKQGRRAVVEVAH
jgi:hypothetical protein